MKIILPGIVRCYLPLTVTLLSSTKTFTSAAEFELDGRGGGLRGQELEHELNLFNVNRIDEQKDCEDFVGWKHPGDSVWKGSAFEGKSCYELEASVSNAFCNFLSQQIYSAPTANEACCFCGGGGDAEKVKPVCKDMVWNEMKGSQAYVDCETIGTLDETMRKKFCDDYGAQSFAEDGLTISEACCACGGGEKHFLEQVHYNASEVSIPPNPLNIRASAEDYGEYEFVSKTQGHRQLNDYYGGDAQGHRQLNDYYDDDTVLKNRGFPNLEYLGSGYDIIRGNPRGTESKELDPGFRFRVIQLKQSKELTTADGKYQIPLGTDVKYTSSCVYDASSSKVTSETEIRSSLNREARTDSSLSTQSSVQYSNLFSSFEASLETSSKFSQSEAFSQAKETNKQSRVESFEARGICSEFEASFVPSYSHTLSPTFEEAMKSLPAPYNNKNKRHRGLWQKFFQTFGTHYIKSLTLGGKRIVSTSMSSSDYASLVSQKVDVESTMSFEMSAAMSASVAVKAGVVKAAASAASALGGPATAAIGGQVNIALEGVDDDTTLFGGGASMAAQSSLANFARNSEQADSAEKISKYKLTQKEYTIGGSPSEDWRVWAQSVRNRPMPISYLFGGTYDFMSFEQDTTRIRL